jgi:Amt family ammonium transporter
VGLLRIRPARPVERAGLAGVVCYFSVVCFKAATGIDDTLDVFALHGVGGLRATVLTPVFPTAAVAPVTATVLTKLSGALALALALALMAYAGVGTWVILRLMGLAVRLRVDAAA